MKLSIDNRKDFPGATWGRCISQPLSELMEKAVRASFLDLEKKFGKRHPETSVGFCGGSFYVWDYCRDHATLEQMRNFVEDALVKRITEN